MTGKRKRYSADFKAKVALEALKGGADSVAAPDFCFWRMADSPAVEMRAAATNSHEGRPGARGCGLPADER